MRYGLIKKFISLQIILTTICSMCSTDQLLRQSKIFANAQSTSQDNQNSLAEDEGDQSANSLLSQDDEESLKSEEDEELA